MVKPKKQKDGRYRASIYLGKDIYGKKKYKDIYGKTEKECNDKIIDFTYKLKHNQIEEKNKNNKLKTFEDFFDDWLYSRDDILDNTVTEYECVKKCHLKKLLKINIEKIDNKLIKHFYSELKNEKGEKIVIRVSKKLNTFLKAMIADENCPITRNVLDNIKIPKVKKSKHYIIKEDEYKTFLKKLKKCYYNSDTYGFLYPLVLICGGCGFRISEALAINYDKDINLEKNYIKIEKEQSNIKGKGHVIVERTKTDAGLRKAIIPKFIKKDLAELIEYKNSQISKILKINPNYEFPICLFIDKNGKEHIISTEKFLINTTNFKMIPKNTAQRNWKNFRESLGYTEQIRIHDFRRFFARLLLKEKVPNVVSIAQMGHAIIEDTEYYQDADTDILNQYISKINI